MSVAGPKKLRRLITGNESKLSMAAASSVLSMGFGSGGRFVLQVLIAQLLGASRYGQFVTLRGWGEMLATLPNRGYHGVALRYLPEYEAGQRWANYRGLLQHALRLTVWGGVAVGVAGAAIGSIIVGELRLSILISLATVPAWAALRMLQAVLQAQHQFVTGSFISEVLQPAILGLAVGGFWLAGVTIGLDGALGMLLLSIAAAAVAAGRSIVTATPEPVPDFPPETDVGQWRAPAVQFYASQLAIAVIGMADVLILAIFVPPAEVALYSIASRISHLGRLINSGLEAIVSPRISAAWASRDILKIQGAVDSSILISTGPTIISAGLLVIFREPILGLVGEEYREAGVVMIILLIGNVVNSMTGPSGYVVSLTGNEAAHARVMMITAVGLVVACLVVAGPGGMVAVAVVRMITNAAWNMGLVVLAKRKLGVRCYPNLGMLPR